MKKLIIICRTAETVQDGMVIEKSRELGKMELNVPDGLVLDEETEKIYSKKASELIQISSTRPKDVYQCNCTIEMVE